MSIIKALGEKLKYAFKRFEGIPVEDDLSRYEAIVREARRIDLGSEDDAALAARARSLRTEIASCPSTRVAPAHLADCLALAAESCRRSLGLEPFDQQLVAAAALCAGKVAQLQTGEGKTLAAALAACYCAMRDGSLHVITANDYLARRDERWMRPIYERLGLSVASVADGDPPGERRLAYRSDIVYLSSRELGFDYLRDGLAASAGDLVQRGFASAIVDEADFVLIDEARVPLVIAGASEDPLSLDAIAAADRVVGILRDGVDYRVDAEGRRVSLTLAGQSRVEEILGVEGIHSAEGAPLFARIHAALHARCLISRDVDYLVAGGAIRLVDAFTGRVAEKRQWPWGVQAALEAKEGLEIGPEGRIFGSITVQHLMGLYPRIAAMTATAVPAASELASAYGMETVVVPPVRPSRRRDEPDAIFWDRESKMRAIAEEALREHRRGRPILIGTASVLESEELASALEREGLSPVLLNAKNDEAEAALIAAAGAEGAMTVSTNMAGRGTDIKLGEGGRLLELGGLYVIGTNRHESRRVDDQLRGRAGRQGDPGLTRFFVSLEDPLFERYGVRDFLPPKYRGPACGHPCVTGRIEDPAVRREIARAQSIIEAENSEIRRSLRKYSLLVEYDRRYVRELRDRALADRELPEALEEALREAGPGMRETAAEAFIRRLDAAWADHLALAEDVKEGLSLLRYGGKEPGIEYVRMLGGAFEDAMRALEEAAIGDCRAILAGGAPVLPAGLPSLPSSTWTYTAREDELPSFGVGGIARSVEGLFRSK